MNKGAEKFGQFIPRTQISKAQLDRVIRAIAKRITGGLGIHVRTMNNQIVISKRKERIKK